MYGRQVSHRLHEKYSQQQWEAGLEHGVSLGKKLGRFVGPAMILAVGP